MGQWRLIVSGILLLQAVPALATPTRIYLRMNTSVMSTSTIAPSETSNEPACTNGCVNIPVCAICTSECPPVEEQPAPPASPVTTKYILPVAWGKDPAMSDAHFHYSANRDSTSGNPYARPKMQIRYEPLGSPEIVERFHAGCYQCSFGGCVLDGAGPVTFDDQVGGGVVLTTDEISPAGLPSSMPAGSTIWIDMWSSDGESAGIIYASAALPTYIEIPYAKDNFQVKGRIAPAYLGAGSTTTFSYFLDNTDITGPDITSVQIDIPGALVGTLFVASVSTLFVDAPTGYSASVVQATKAATGKLTVNFSPALAAGQSATVYFSGVAPIAPVQNMLWGAQAISSVNITVAELTPDSRYTAVLPTPVPPGTLAVSPQNTAGAGGTLRLTWNYPGSAVIGAVTGYRVYRGNAVASATTWVATVPPSGVAGTGPPGWSPTLTIVTQTVALRLDDAGLPNGQLAAYTVAAVNPIGESVASAGAWGTPYQDPRQVNSLTALVRSGTVELAWDPAAAGTYGVAAYELRRATCAACAITSSVFVSPGTASTYVDTTVTNGSTYRYEVRAVDVLNHYGALSPTATGSPAANPPGGLTLLYDPVVGGVALQWSPATGNVFALSGYVVYRASCSACAPAPSASVWVSPATTVYVDTAVATGQLFLYSVATLTNEGGLMSGPRSSALRILVPPAAPFGLTVLPRPGTALFLRWSITSNSPGQVNNYRLYRSIPGTTSVFSTPFASQAFTNTEYTDSGLSLGARYYYRVTAVLTIAPDTAESPPSAVVSQVIEPSAPTGLTGIAQDGIVRLSWTDQRPGEEVNAYLLYRASGAPPGATLLLASVTASYYDDTAVTNGDTYTYRLAASNAGGVSTTSADTLGLVPYRPPQPPGWLSTVSGLNRATLMWGPAPTTTYPLASYEIYRGTAPGAMALVQTVGFLVNSYLNLGLQNGTTYWFKVRALDSVSNAGPFGNTAAVTPAIPPCPPASLTGVVTSGQVGLSWSPVTGGGCGFPPTFPVSGYTVYRSTYAGGGRSLLYIATGQYATAYTDAAIAVGITYYYAVRAFDTVLPPNESVSYLTPFGPAYSPEVAATPRIASGAPGSLTVLPGSFAEHDTKLHLAWAPSATGTFQIIGYDVYRSLGVGAPETRIFVSGAVTASYVDTGLTNGVFYYYRVAPLEDIGVDGEWSGVGATPYFDPAAPAILTLREGDATLTLSWSPAPATTFPVTGYRITRATYPGFLSGAGVVVGPDPVFATTYADTPVANAVPWWYRVQTWDNRGNLSVARSPEASGTPFTPPAPPAWLTMTSLTGSVSLAWVPALPTTYPVSAYVVYRSTFAGVANCPTCAIATVWGAGASVYLSTGLTNGVTVFAAVATRDDLGHIGPPGNVVANPPAVPPCPPVMMTAQSGLTTVALQWAPVNGALCGIPSTFPVSGYRIWRATSFGGPAVSLMDIVGPAVTTYTDAAPVPGLTYYYRVGAYDNRVPVNEGPSAAPDVPGTARTPAGPPLGLTVQGEPFEHDRMAKLMWSAATAVTLPVIGYDVYRSSCSGCPETKVFGPGSAATLSYLDTNISNTVYWAYRVTTVELGFFEGASAVTTTTPFADPLPPVALTVREGTATLTLGWTPAAFTSYPVTAYRIMRASFAGAVSLTLVADTVYATTYTDSPLANGVPWYYVLQAWDTKGHLSHAYSGEVSGTPFVLPAAPANLTAAPGDKRITVSWDAAAAGTYPVGGYAVYRLASADPGCGGTVHWTVGAGTLQLIDTVPANDGTFWDYRVAAFDAVSGLHLGPCSNLVSSSAYAGIDPPGAPGALSAVPVGAVVGLKWAAAAATTRPIAGYGVHRTTFAGNPATPLDWTGSVTGATASVYVDAATANGFVYYYRTRAYDDYTAAPVSPGPYISVPSNEVAAFIAQAPQNLTVLALIQNQLYVGWDVPAVDPAGIPIAGYRVYRATGAAGPYALAGTTATVTYFDDTGVTRGQPSYFRVAAEHQGGWLTGMSSTGFSTPGGAPSPAVVSAAADDGFVAVSWGASASLFPPLTYAILRGTFAGFPANGVPHGSVAAAAPLTYTDLGATSVVNGMPYYYRVITVDSGGVTTTSVTEPYALPLARPQTLTCSPGDARVMLGWGLSPNGPGGVSGYFVYRRTLTQAEGVAATLFGFSATSYLDLAVANGVMYYYRVRTFDSITTPTNVGPWSNDTQGRPVTPPGPPNIAQIWASFGQVDLCWTGASPPGTNPTGGYKVWRSSNGGPFVQIATVGSGTCLTDSGLQNGVLWGYRVAAFDTSAPPVDGPQSNTVSALPFDVPAAPTAVTAYVASGELLIGWAASVPTTFPVAGYELYRGTATQAESPVAINGATVAATSYLDTPLVNGTRYFYKIRARDTAGHLSATSAENSAVPFDPPSPPALAGTAGDRRVDVSWTGSTGTYLPMTYAVYRATFAGFTPGAAQALIAPTTYADLTVTNGIPYYYRIGARDADLTTGPHETLSNEHYDLPLGIPTSLSALPGDTLAGLSWTPSTLGLGGIAGYEVWRNAPLMAPVLLATVSGATASVYLDLTATNGVTWTYRVAAIDSLIAPITPGAFSATVSTTPGVAWSAPVLTTAAPSNQRVDLAWTAPTISGSLPLSSYRLFRSSAGGPFALWQSLPPSVLSFADQPVTNGVAWSYYLTAVDSSAPPIESPPSNVRTAVPFQPPLPPGDLTVLVRDGQVYLGWATTYLSGTSTVYVQTSYPPSGFVIYRGTTPNFAIGAPIAFVTPGSVTYYLDAAGARPGIYPTSPLLPQPFNPAIHVANGVTYYYKIQTNDTNGNVSLTQSLTVNGTPFAPPAPPGWLTALPFNLGVRLNWATPYLVSAVSTTPSNTVWVGGGTYGPVAGYLIYRGLAPGTGTLLAGPVFATTYVDTTASNGTAWFYTVRALNSRGDPGAPSTEETSTPSAALVNPPLTVDATIAAGGITVTWSTTIPGAVPVDQYVVVRATCAACLYDTLTLGASPYVSSTTPAFAVTDATVLSGGYYRYAVRSVVLAPYTESLDYPWTVVTIPSSCAPPGSPGPVLVTTGSTIATVTWSVAVKGCPADFVMYRLERSADGGASWLVLSAATSLLTWNETGLVNGTTYLWRVTPFGTGGLGTAAVSAPATPASRPNAALLTVNAFAPFRTPKRVYLEYTLETAVAPRTSVYTLSGLKVLELEDPYRAAGPATGVYSVLGSDGLPGWDGRATDGHVVASGVYLIEFRAGTFHKSLKVIVLK